MREEGRESGKKGRMNVRRAGGREGESWNGWTEIMEGGEKAGRRERAVGECEGGRERAVGRGREWEVGREQEGE